MQTNTFATVVAQPLFQKSRVLTHVFLIVLGSMLMALLAQISINLPFTPVPITGQTLGVVLVGATLGAKRGAISQVLYILEGSAGLPVFAGGVGGIVHLVGPTGGYFVGFVVAAFIVGWFAERGWDRDWKKAFIPFMLAQGVIFFFGVIWLARFLGWEGAIVGGVLPFIPGGILKAIIASAILPAAWKGIRYVEKRHNSSE